MKVLIVDDELRARENMRKLLDLFCEGIDEIIEAEGIQAALIEIAQHAPDLILLDIQMGDGTGFDLLRKIKEPKFKVIFVTAFDEFAIEAFKFSAIDYLLKPVLPEDLTAAIDRARHKIEKEKLNVEALFQNISGSDDKNIVLKTAESVYLIKVKDIVRCQSDGNYTTFYIKDGRKIMVSKLLKEYDELLSKYGFFRVHQSNLINMNYFKEYDKKVEVIHMQDGGEVPLSTRKKESFLEMLSNL